MRIALLSYEYPPETGFGGIGTYTYYHAHALARLGHEVHVFAGAVAPERRTYRDGDVTVTRLRMRGFVERLVPRANDLGLNWFKDRLLAAVNSYSSLRRALRKGRFDVVEMPECGGEGALLNHVLDLPTVVRLHSPAELIMPIYGSKAGDRVLTAMVERIGMSGAKAVSSCSSWLAEEARRRGLLTRPITVIPNGIDLAQFDQDDGIDVFDRFGIPREGTKIFFANRLERRKGIHVVRDLLVPVLRRHADVTFVLAGLDPDGVVDRELRPRLAEHGFEHRLLVLGRISLAEVRACLKQCEIFLLASTWENAPYSLLEAMAARRAIVASDCGGVPEMLRHDIDGLIARNEDVAAFTRAIDRLQNAKLRKRLGESARARIESRYTDDIVARQSVRFYRWALGAPARRATERPDGERKALGPGDWYDAWWLRGEIGGDAPAVPPSLAELGIDELAFVHAVVARTYWDQRGRSDDGAVAFLDDLATLHRERALRADDGEPIPAITGALGMPVLDHALFAHPRSLDTLVQELWRLGEHPFVADWLDRLLAAPQFVERALRDTSIRRLAVDAFRRRPCEATAAVLRKIYRAVGHAARVVQQDVEYIARHPQGAAFGALVADLGLHAPMRQAPAFATTPNVAAAAADGPQVTVLIPSYRHEAFVVRAIESALAQTYGQVQVLVVDDVSPDDTVAAARTVGDPRVEVRRNPRNVGLGGSLLAALDTVTTPYVALLNSDDVFHPERLEQCLRVLEHDGDAQLVASRVAVMDEKERRLTSVASCVVDRGPSIHGWVRWYDQVTSTLAERDWVSPLALLRHNHLATSSNVVCRTDFLRAHAAAIAPLKYCLDWSLFLHAAIAGQLRVVAQELVGYRLHGSNTVWFDEGTRPGYVYEVNTVVADALRVFVARRHHDGAAPAAVAEELAALVGGGVSLHGETDGFAMCIAALTGGLGAVPADYRSPALVALAERALAAHKTPPAPLTDRRDVQRNTIEALRRRANDLERRSAWLEQETARLRDRDRDVGDVREHVDALHSAAQAASAQQERLRAELAAANERVAALGSDLDAMRREVATTTRALAEALAGGESDRASHREAVAELQGRLESVGNRLHQAELDGDRLAATQRAAQARAWHASLLDAQHRVDEQRNRDAMLQGLDFRLGRLLLRKLHLLGVAKTTLRAWTGARVRLARCMLRFGRPRAGAPGRVVMLAEDAFPSPDSGRLAGELQAVLRAGFDAKLFCWRSASAHWLGGFAPDAVRRRVVLGHDAALQAKDRRWFARRASAATAALESSARQLGYDASVVFTFARTARAAGAAYLHAVGLGYAAYIVQGGHRLLSVPFGLRLERADLERLREERWLEVARAAAALFVDGQQMADRVRTLLGSEVDIVVVPPLLECAPSAPRERRTIACVGPFADPDGLLLLADAVADARSRGCDPRVVVLGSEVGEAGQLAVVSAFRSMLAEHEANACFEFRDTADPAQLFAVLRQAVALVDVRTAARDEIGGPWFATVAAFACGAAVLGVDGALAVSRDAQQTLAEGGDRRALADAIVALMTGAAHSAAGHEPALNFATAGEPMFAKLRSLASQRR